MSKQAKEYFDKHRVVGDYLDKESVVSMMNGYATQYHKEQLRLCGVGVTLPSKEETDFEDWMKINNVHKTKNSDLYLYDDGLLTKEMVKTVYEALKPKGN